MITTASITPALNAQIASEISIPAGGFHRLSDTLPGKTGHRSNPVGHHSNPASKLFGISPGPRSVQKFKFLHPVAAR